MVAKAETRIVQQIIRWVKEHGGTAHHVHGSAAQRAGEPDIDGALPLDDGSVIHFKVEVKTGTNKPTELQKYRLAEYHRLRYTAGVVTSLDEFVAMMVTARQLSVRDHIGRWRTQEEWDHLYTHGAWS